MHVAAVTATPPSDPRARGVHLQNLSNVLDAQGRYEDAMEAMEEAVEMFRLSEGEDAPYTISARGNLPLIYQRMGRWQEAERLYEENIEQMERVYGPDHLNLAHVLHNHATLYLNMQGDTLGRAEPLLKRALDIRRAALGADHSDVLDSRAMLATAYKQQRKYAEAEPIMLDALARSIQTRGEDDPNVAVQLVNLGNLYYDWGDSEKALTNIERARVIFERLGLSEHPVNGVLLRNLANVYVALGRADEGLPHVLRAEEIHMSGQGANDAQRVRDLEVYEEILRDLGRAAEADSVRDVSLALVEAADIAGR